MIELRAIFSHRKEVYGSMKVKHIEVDKVSISEDLVACIGYFDGFHVGHQALFKETLKEAKKYKLKSGLITFDPDPWVTIRGAKDVTHISTMNDRMKWAEEFGFDYFIILDFTKEMAGLSPEDFVEKLLVDNHIKHLVCGFDFHFGDKGKGNTDFLRSKCKEKISVCEIKEVSFNNEKISTTRINGEIEKGNMEFVRTLLSRPYMMHGHVIHGNEKGRTIGVPTANVGLDEPYVLPKVGVYVGKAEVRGKEYMAMINIGHNPTFNLVNNLSIEAHILDFNEIIYGEPITLYFYNYIRDEQKFSSVDELKKMLMQNIKDTRDYFGE